MKDGKYVILCVDDDADIRDWMHTVLEAEGYLVVSAASAEEGKKQFQESNPDLVIVDLMMEEVDSGTVLVKELKALGSNAPVYMLSAAGDTLSTTTDYGDLGLSGVFQKPLSPEALLPVLKAKLG